MNAFFFFFETAPKLKLQKRRLLYNQSQNSKRYNKGNNKSTDTRSKCKHIEKRKRADKKKTK